MHGFTLVELLIALVILSVITLLLFSGLRLGSRAWESVETVSERLADLRLARNFIERSLRQVRKVELRVEGQKFLVFSGQTDQLEFVAPLSSHVGVPGLYILRLTLEDTGDNTKRLVLTRWLLHPDVLNGTDNAPAWQPLTEASNFGSNGDALDRDLAAGAQGRTLLLPQVGHFVMSYYGLQRGEQVPGWYDEWLDQSELPYRVRLDLSTPEQNWPVALISLPGPGVLVEGR
ncbi:general secretion pathway protein GspJ [Rhabdochromatium marinum]|nr:general secretion pathway protein GspJ [Rhabdochromatium marinum]